MGQLPQCLSGLLDVEAYAHPVRCVDLIETHISWVLLTGDYAYKIKRPVCYPFLDMRDVGRRLELCREELRLNQRFSRGLYLDVCPIVCRGGRARMGGAGEAIEHAVKMRQFPDGQALSQLVEAGCVETAELQAFGTALAGIHESLPRATADAPHAASVRGAILSNLEQAAAFETQRFGTHRIQALRPVLNAALEELEPWMTERLAGGHFRECHGDLHSGNVVRWERRLQAFDCLEFDPALRCMDISQEVAFLLADLEARGAGSHAHAFLTGYLTRSGDYPACRGLSCYKAHCALVRAKVMALSTDDRDRWCGFSQFVDEASRALAPPRPVLVVMSGLSGSGKSALARQLAAPLHAVHIQSDVERRRLATRTGQESVYTPQAIDRVYEHLHECAADLLGAGTNVIIDATFLSRARRIAVRDFALRLHVPLRIMHCGAPVGILRQRVALRAATGSDPSEADAEVLQSQLRDAEPIRPDENLSVVEVDTSRELGPAALHELVERCR